jgi:hypothetical protein
MKTNVSNYIKTITSIIKDIPHTKQWVLFTPTFSVSTWISSDQSLSDQRFEIISGAHTNRFNDALEQFKQLTLNGLIVSFEQTLNPIKFSQLLDTIKDVDVLILDQAHRGHLHSLYYSIEMEVMVRQLNTIKPKEIHQLIAAFQSPLNIRDSIVHQLSIPIEILRFPHNLEACLNHVSQYKRILWVAQTFNEANAISAYLSFVNIDHALIHKKVEETIKISMQQRFILKELNVCVTTIETQLPLDIQGIDCIVLSFDVRSDQVLSFFVPYVNENATWVMIDWFKSIDLSVLGHAINENMFDFIHHVSMIEGGCSMREAERTLNIDSYEFERIIKFLKGRSIIKKVGLKYIIDQSEAIHSLYEEVSETVVLHNNINIVEYHPIIMPFPEGVVFPIISKKIMPVGFYDFTTIPHNLKHEDGFIFVSKPDSSTLNHFLNQHQIDCVIDFTSIEKKMNDTKWLNEISLPVLPIQLSKIMVTSEAKNPYQRVKSAKTIVDNLVFPKVTQFSHIAVVLNNYDEGWFLSVLSIALKNQAPHCQIYPICLDF